jgi:hypothetical protein
MQRSDSLTGGSLRSLSAVDCDSRWLGQNPGSARTAFDQACCKLLSIHFTSILDFFPTIVLPSHAYSLNHLPFRHHFQARFQHGCEDQEDGCVGEINSCTVGHKAAVSTITNPTPAPFDQGQRNLVDRPCYSSGRESCCKSLFHMPSLLDR